MKKVLALAALAMMWAAVGAAFAQKINPATQVNWPLIAKSGTPASQGITCTSANYGQPYMDTSLTPNQFYTCGSDGWAVRGGGGGGSALPGTAAQIITTNGSGSASAATATADATGALTVPGTFAATGTVNNALNASLCNFHCESDTVTYPNSLNAGTQGLSYRQLTSYGAGRSEQNQWRFHTVHYDRTYIYDRGIAQMNAIYHNHRGTGDTAGQYQYVWCNSGLRTTSDEGCEMFSSNGGEQGNLYLGTIVSIDASNTLPVLSSPNSGASNWLIDGSFLIDTKTATATGNLNGSSAIVPGFSAIRYLPVTNTLPLTTAFCQSLNALPNVANKPTDQANLQTISCVPGMINGAINPIAGPTATPATFTGQILGNTLTASAVTGTIQIGARLFGPNVVIGNIVTAQLTGTTGGAGTYTTSQAGSFIPGTFPPTPTASGPMESVASPTIGIMTGTGDTEQLPIVNAGATPAQAICTGSTAGSTLTISACSSGTIAVGQYLEGNGVQALTTVTALGTGTGGAGTYTLSKAQATLASQPMGTTGTQTVVIAHRSTGNGNPYLFQGGVAGTYISFDDNVTKISHRTTYSAIGSLTGTDLLYWVNVYEGTSDMLLPATGEPETILSPYHLYPGAEIVANLNGGLQGRLEPNNVTWAANDPLEDPQYPVVGIHGLHIDVQQDSSNFGHSDGMIMDMHGTGIGNGITFYRAYNGSTSPQYAAYGGWQTRPTGYSLEGYFEQGLLMTTAPFNGGSVVSVGGGAIPTSQGTITGSISGTTLTVTAINTGLITSGQVLTGSGVPAGVVISAPIAPTLNGGLGNYQLNTIQPNPTIPALTSQAFTVSAGPYNLLRGVYVNLSEDPITHNATLATSSGVLYLSSVSAGGVTVDSHGMTVNGPLTQSQAVIESIATYTASLTNVKQTNPETMLFNSASNLSATLNCNCAGYTTGTIFRFKALGTGTLTINGYSGSLIDGASTAVLTTGQAQAIQFDGTNWYSIASPSSAGTAGLAYTTPTLNYIPKVTNATAPGTLGNSSIVDNGSTVTTTKPVVAPVVAVNAALTGGQVIASTGVTDFFSGAMRFLPIGSSAANYGNFQIDPLNSTGGLNTYTSGGHAGVALDINGGTGLVSVSSFANSGTYTQSGTGVNTFTGSVTAPNVTDSALTSGNCVQAGTGGLLTTAAVPCPTIANVVVAGPTTTLAANTCTAAATVTMTGVTTTSAFRTAFATDPNGVAGWGANQVISFVPWPTANTLNYRFCNTSLSSVTPGAININVGAQ